MVIEKVHGLQATTLSLNDRFTLLAKAAPDRVMRQQQQRRRNSLGPSLAQKLNLGNQLLVEQVARQLEMQAKRALRQRLGIPQTGLRRFGSESNLPRLRRSNSFGNLSQQSVKNRVSWRNNGNLSRSASFSNLTSASWRGFRRRAGVQRQLRGRFRGRGARGRNGLGGAPRAQYRVPQRNRAQPTPLARRGRGAARGRGGVNRTQQKPITKEELDRQLDQYMASSKAALDIELENYMKNAMEME
ncbi:unnamed protein product [Arctia plantaginis]|uniref:Chromatin target of PRMT1 protein C-terminal domain-containing protein n=1 Tax=Arctia plantaginis TaxID=874455 RepID=A0A8S0ZIP1_ARCPL|nr:unnamed protein product [Arctia plantaginis]